MIEVSGVRGAGLSNVVAAVDTSKPPKKNPINP